MIQDIVCGITFTYPYGLKLSEFKGTKYYFCCSHCKNIFDADPIKYINEKMTENQSGELNKKDKWERDPVCGERIKISEAKGFTLYKNARYYFCCKICKKTFDANPSAYSDKEEGSYDPKNQNDFLDGRFRIL